MKSRTAILLAATCLLMLAGCAPKAKDLSLDNYRLENVSPTGLRGVDVTLMLTITNRAVAFTISDICGTVFKDGTEFALFSAEPLALKGKSTETYPLNASLSLSESVSLFDLIGLVRDHDMDSFMIDLHARGSLKGGIGKDIDMNNVPLSRLIKAFE